MYTYIQTGSRKCLLSGIACTCDGAVNSECHHAITKLRWLPTVLPAWCWGWSEDAACGREMAGHPSLALCSIDFLKVTATCIEMK